VNSYSLMGSPVELQERAAEAPRLHRVDRDLDADQTPLPAAVHGRERCG